VFEALFGSSSFVTENPVARSMTDVLNALHEKEAIDQERAELAKFYRSVRVRAEKIDNLEGRQRVIKELYEVSEACIRRLGGQSSGPVPTARHRRSRR